VDGGNPDSTRLIREVQDEDFDVPETLLSSRAEPYQATYQEKLLPPREVLPETRCCAIQ
jgi:hypothetical protein